MGGSKKQTVGYWYPWSMHFGWCKGVVDAVLEWRAGGKTAWQGRMTASGRISVNLPNLWGGESQQGGVVGDMDIMFGEQTQAPNDYLTSTFGPEQSAHRGKLTTVFRGGRYGANIPNPQTVSLKVERILADWENDTPWYPEKAAISMDSGDLVINDTAFPATSAGIDPVVNGVTINSGFTADDTIILAHDVGMTYQAWSRWDSKSDVPPGRQEWTTVFNVVDGNGVKTTYWDNDYDTADEAEAAVLNSYVYLTGSTSYTIGLSDNPVNDNRGGLSLRIYKNGLSGELLAMNPAHMIYDSITFSDMQGEPIGMINDASFRAAADQLYAEGFGLCTTYDSSAETPLQFRQRICNVIGANVSQSRLDGLYYLDLIRAVTDISTLPVISELTDDIISFTQDASITTETTNTVSVSWTDPQAKQDRTTAPVHAMGAIQSVGKIIAATNDYKEIPTESLALRVATRDSQALATPTNKMTLTIRHILPGLRPGLNVVLQAPSEGIASMVLVCGSVAHGTSTDGRLKIVGVENIYDLPATAYVNATPGLWKPTPSTPTPSPNQIAFEAPYIELAQTLSAADLAALAPDAGYLLTAASPPSGGVNYGVDTAATGEAYAERATADWTPIAKIVEAAGYLDTAFTIASGQLLDRVDVGSWAMWDSEIVRVDALDTTANTVTLARGCADTLPAVHAAASVVYFCGEWTGTDQREYVGGETVNAKLLTNLGSSSLSLDNAPTLSVLFADRQALPYPPGNLLIGGTYRPAAVNGNIAVTWATRNRTIQADQVIDTTAASITPEDDVRYAVQFFDGTGALIIEKLDVGGTGATASLAYTGQVTMKVYAINTNGISMQMHSVPFAYTAASGVTESTIDAVTWTPVQIIIDGGQTGT
ncbi:hypothetical protein [Rhodanobacter sp. BL-MT-08]